MYGIRSRETNDCEMLDLLNEKSSQTEVGTCSTVAILVDLVAQAITNYISTTSDELQDHLIADHKIAKSDLDIGRRQPGETEALLWERLFMKQNPEWLDSHPAIPSPC